MDSAIQRFEQYLNRRFGQTSTLKHYHNDLVIFAKVIGPLEPAAVKPTDIDRFIEAQISAGLAASTIKRRLSCIHSFFEYLASEALERQWSNPVISKRHGLKTGQHLPRDVKDSAVKALFAQIETQRDRAIFTLMVAAGLRVGEVVRLTLDSLHPTSSVGRLNGLRVVGKGNKERMVWLSASTWDVVQAWLSIRPPVAAATLFVNQHGQPLSVAGVEYRLKGYAQQAGLKLSCHQLRHTFARRLAEEKLPVDSLAKLLGHSQLQTTMRYIDGADPTVQEDFARAIQQAEVRAHPSSTASTGPALATAPSSQAASLEELDKLREKLVGLPDWLAEAVSLYLGFRWPTWRAATAYSIAFVLVRVVHRVWTWLAVNRQVTGWSSLRRADLEAWLQARSLEGVRPVTIQNELGHWRMLFKFLQARDYPLDPGLFRIQPPQAEARNLPRYLPEAAYDQLERAVLEATQADTYRAALDRAWFLTLAHTGVRLSELRDIRLADVQWDQDSLLVRGAKRNRDRMVYLTVPLKTALERYMVQRPVCAQDHLFVLSSGRVPSAVTFRMRLLEYSQPLGLHVYPHQLRHTLATRLLNRGMPIISLRKLLGHQDLKTTQIYAQVYDETLQQQFQAAMARVEAIGIENWPVMDQAAAPWIDEAIPSTAYPTGHYR